MLFIKSTCIARELNAIVGFSLSQRSAIALVQPGGTKSDLFQNQIKSFVKLRLYMKLMCPQKRFALLVISFFLAFAFLNDNISAQSKKKTTAKKPTASAKADVKKKDTRRKDASNSRTAKKASAKDSRSAKNDRSKKSNSRTAKNEPKAKKLSAREQARLDAKSKKAPKETKRQAAERRRQEEIRRQAALAEQRRREQAAREARERRLAFERGLRTETVDNIAKDNTDGEDIRVRNAAIEALGNRAGTVVVMESQTGKLLTVVNQDWAIKNGFKPCSTIKLVTGLNESVINGDGTIAGDPNSMNLDTAIAFSKNPYFQRVGVKMGNAKMIDYARTLGLGQKTGINAEGETPGKLPYGNSNPRVYSHGDDFEVTPLQLAVLVSALSNGGNKVVPIWLSRRLKGPRIGRNLAEDSTFHRIAINDCCPE